MANTFTPGGPFSGPWYIDRDDCIGDSLAYINANTNYLANGILQNTASITTLQAQLANATQPGTILQSNYVTLSAGDVKRNSATASVVSQIPNVSLTRIQSTSDILIKLRGGSSWSQTGAKGFRTWFYVNENNTGFQAAPPRGGFGAAGATNLNVVQFKTLATTSATDPHEATLIYTPASNIVTITAQIWAAAFDTTEVFWNRVTSSTYPSVATVPIIFSISEIKR